jgi:hypothetical protein
MQQKNTMVAASNDSQSADKLYMESNLLRVAGALFCHDAKRAGNCTSQIEINPGVIGKHIVIRPDPKLGQPGPLAHKLFVALIKKHSDCGRPVQTEISFTRREIGRLIGRKEWGGRDSEQLSRALHEIHYTFVTMHFKNSEGRYVEHSFNIFPEIFLERREFASDPIEACTITLANPIIASLQEEHFTCLNHPLMMQLGTIGQALYMRTFFHFANLYTGVNGSRLAFQKRYDDVCTEWLGGLTIHQHRSFIEGRQLGVHLKQLVDAEFLSEYGIAKAKGRGGFILTFKPGRAFFEDYDRFYRRRIQGEDRSGLTPDPREVGEPLRFAYLFAEKRTGQPVGSVAFVNTKDVETAKQLLSEITFAEAPAFLDFALGAARSTNFDVQTLGGLRQYLAPFKARQVARASTAKQETVRRCNESERLAYDGYRRNEAASILEGLSIPERHAIEESARLATVGFKGALYETMLRVKRHQLVAQHYDQRIKSYDEWKSIQQPGGD